jgi:branched-chain amino acid transport system substrate-binding protein
MKFKGRMIAVTAVVALSMLTAACASSGTPTASNGAQAFVIGFPNDITGSNAFAGVEQQQAAQMAVDDLNKAGGKYQYSLKVVDTKSSTAGAVAAMQQLQADHDVKAIVGIASTGSALAIMPQLVQSKLPSIMLQVTDLTGRANNVFSMAPPTAPLQQNMVDLLKQRNLTRLGIIYTQEPTTQANANALVQDTQGTNIQVVANEGVDTSATDVSPQVTKVIAANPDAVAVEGKPVPSGTMASQLRAAGYTGLIFGQQGIQNASFRQTAGAATVGVLFTSFWDPSIANADAKQFVTDFQAANPTLPAPDTFALQAWDAVHFVATATDAAGTDPAALSSAIASTTFDAASADKVAFDSNGFAKLDGHIIQFTDTGTELVQ